MTKKRIKSQDENITTEDLGNGYTRIRVEGPNSVQRARDFIDTNFDNPAYYQGDLKDLEVEAYTPNSPAALFYDQLSRQARMPTASDLQISYKVPHYSPDKVNDTVSDVERERYLHNLEKSGFDFDYANKVLKADRHAQQYNPVNFLYGTGINVLDPSQWVGATSDLITDKTDTNGNRIGFWTSLGQGNSGFVTDKFMKEHPILGPITNMVGGSATIGLGNKVLNLTKPLVQQGYGIFQNGVNSIQGRFSPGGWFTLGNKQYKPSMSTLSSVSPVIESKPAWSLQKLPGYHIKSTLTGSPLEKQLSKNGTLSLKQLQAYVNRNDVSTIDKELLGKVLQNHANDRVIDYNTLRQEVQGMIPQYTQHPESKYATYGMDGLGFQINKVSDGAGGLVETYSGFKPKTFTFESPGIKGNAKHYNRNTLGHSRTYTTTDEPDVLYVMESQSDWAQNRGIVNIDAAKDPWIHQYNKYKQMLDNQDFSRFSREQLENKVKFFKRMGITSPEEQFQIQLENYMTKSYLNRQLQENLRYAAQNGQTKMRYPTPETAAKIEGYTKSEITPEYREALDKLNSLTREDRELTKFPDEIDLNSNTSIYYTPQQKEQLIRDTENRIESLKISQKDRTYPSQHLTILKKYADFPKQFQKLFGKQTPVRTVTDTKGNTWYEVDVPQNYLNGTAEMLFKKGGKLNPVERFKKYRR